MQQTEVQLHELGHLLWNGHPRGDSRLRGELRQPIQLLRFTPGDEARELFQLVSVDYLVIIELQLWGSIGGYPPGSCTLGQH